MSQAEIAGGPLTLANGVPAKGHRLRDFELPCSEGGQLRLSAYRGRKNLVLILADSRPATTALLVEAGERYGQFREEQAEILAVMQLPRAEDMQGAPGLNLPYPVLTDEDGRVRRQLGAADASGQAVAAVYVTDRFGEVFGLYRTRDGHPLPAVAEILNWLEFINSQCPECEAPEWPADTSDFA